MPALRESVGVGIIGAAGAGVTAFVAPKLAVVIGAGTGIVILAIVLAHLISGSNRRSRTHVQD